MARARGPTFGRAPARRWQRVHQPQADHVGALVEDRLIVGDPAPFGLGRARRRRVPEPVLLLTLYVLMGKRDRVREKAIGTAVGVIAVAPAAIAAPPALMSSVIAWVAFLLSFAAYSKQYWLYYALFTFALVLALAPPGHPGSEAAHRGSEILIATAILVVGLAIVHALGNWLAERYPDPELA